MPTDHDWTSEAPPFRVGLALPFESLKEVRWTGKSELGLNRVRKGRSGEVRTVRKPMMSKLNTSRHSPRASNLVVGRKF